MHVHALYNCRNKEPLALDSSFGPLPTPDGGTYGVGYNVHIRRDDGVKGTYVPRHNRTGTGALYTFVVRGTTSSSRVIQSRELGPLEPRTEQLHDSPYLSYATLLLFIPFVPVHVLRKRIPYLFLPLWHVLEFDIKYQP